MGSERGIVRWGVVVFIVWTLGIGASSLYTIHYIKRFSLNSAKLTGKSLIEETILFRSWNAKNGGVYAPVSPTTPPNPYLKVPERNITTPSGKALTKVNPAYMTRQVFELQKKRLGVQGHITSLKPLNPHNAPDQWEKKALHLFEKGVKEYAEEVSFRGKPAMRIMLPLTTEKVCLKCHTKQGYKLGDIRGGISVYVPLNSYLTLARQEIARTAMVDLFLWLIGVLFIALGTSRAYAEARRVTRSEQRFRSIFENSPEPIFLFDGERITDCNQAMVETLGAKDKEELLRHPAEISPEHQPDGLPSFKKFNSFAGDVLLHGNARFKWLFHRPDGEEVWVDASASKVPREGNKGHEMLVSCRDVTKETLLQDRILQLRKLQALGELAAGIAHDFNNTLAVVIGNITLARDFGVSQKADEMLKNAEQAVLKAANLTRKLITFSPGGRPVSQTVSVRELLGESAKAMKEKAPSIKFKVETDPNLWSIKGDPHQLFNTFSSILENAVESMPEGGVVRVKAENATVSQEESRTGVLPEGRYVKVTIEDQGCGIPVATQDQIFDPFFTTKELGRGLGLSIAYSVIQRHGGEIEVRSRKGEGTAFVIYLPVEEDAARRLGTKGKVLVMEDDPYQRELFTALLSNLGYSVVAVENGERAVEEFVKAQEDNAPFNVVILDLLVPEGMDGKATGKAILEQDPNAKVIITSVAASDKAVTNFKEYGFVGSLPKPFTLRDLATAVERAMNVEKT